MIMKLF